MMDLNQAYQDIKQEKAILIDVREDSEWNKEHLQHAIHCPLSSIEAGDLPPDLPKDQPIYLHCRRGGRAQQAAELLKNQYPQATALKCEFEELKKMGF
jgi:rhodanese-related sulfurtransferase